MLKDPTQSHEVSHVDHTRSHTTCLNDKKNKILQQLSNTTTNPDHVLQVDCLRSAD